MKKPSLKDLIFIIVIVLLDAALTTVSVLYGLASKKNTEKTPTYYEKKCAAFELENFNYSKGQIVFIGDSITDGYPLDSHYAALPLETYNRGISGDTSDGVLGRLQVSVIDLAPAKVVLLIGINDINGGRDNDAIMTNYAAILREIKSKLPSVDMTCLSVLPMSANVENWGIDLPRATAQIKDLNTRIKALAEETGVRFVDLYPHFSDGNDRLIEAYTDDGLHPNGAGYVVWTNVLKPYLYGGA